MIAAFVSAYDLEIIGVRCCAWFLWGFIEAPLYGCVVFVIVWVIIIYMITIIIIPHSIKNEFYSYFLI